MHVTEDVHDVGVHDVCVCVCVCARALVPVSARPVIRIMKWHSLNDPATCTRRHNETTPPAASGHLLSVFARVCTVRAAGVFEPALSYIDKQNLLHKGQEALADHPARDRQGAHQA